MQEEQKNAGTGSGGPDRLVGMQEKVDRLGRLYSDLQAAQVTCRRTRIGVTIIIVLVILAYAVAIYNAGRQFVNKEVPKFMAELQVRAPEVLAKVQREAWMVAQEVGPVYRDEVQKQLRENWPEMRASLQKEGQAFLDNVRTKAEARISEKLAAMTERQTAYLAGEFKDVMNDQTRETIMTNLETALRDATLNVLEERITAAADKLAAVNEQILGFLPEGQRDSFQVKMRKLWEELALEAGGGYKEIR